jgi:hypothetical protein
MASASERLKIFENIISKVGLDGDVLGEYSKAMSMLNGLQTMNEMNPPMPPPQAQPMGQELPPSDQSGGMITPNPTQSTNQGLMP